MQSIYQAAKTEDFKTAWRQGVLAAYLNVTVILLAVLVAALCIGLVLVDNGQGNTGLHYMHINLDFFLATFGSKSNRIVLQAHETVYSWV